jgi:dTDP-4-amino-4,6-dideoxygalactose transaminase
VANGTDAIVLALKSLGIGVGDAVFTVSHTAVATVAAIELTGATPVLVDVEAKSYTLDPQKLKDSVAAVAASGKLAPKAVVGVHLYGHPFDIPAISDICRKHALFLVEDCAQAHGATFEGRHVGTFGDAGTFSFYPTKNLPAFGDGGSVIFRDAATADTCRTLREYGWRERYLSDIAGMNSRLDELHAAILRVRLQYLDEEIATRRAAAAVYDDGLAGLVTVPSLKPGMAHAYHLYVIRSERRNALKERLTAAGIGTGIHYPVPVHQQGAYAGRVLIGAGGMEITEEITDKILSLPMHGFLSKEDATAVVSAVRGWHGHK